MKKILYTTMLLVAALSSCKNADWEFPDYGKQSVYFAYQSPIRTVTFGEDIFDTSLDNQGKVQIMATTGGVYSNKQDITIGIAVDNQLTQGLKFSPAPFTGNVIPMPANYYKLASDKIIIAKGQIIGGVEVQLTDAFFADPLSLKPTYVIPIVMKSVQNADSILSTKKQILYAVRFVNTWHGFYLRRGKDVVVGKAGNSSLNGTLTRHLPFVEKDEVNGLTTASLTQANFPVIFKGVGGVNVSVPLLLKFDTNGNCTISSSNPSFIASGNGKFVKRGEINSWGSKDRDALYLNYQVELSDRTVTTTDTLVLRDRGVKAETFIPIN